MIALLQKRTGLGQTVPIAPLTRQREQRHDQGNRSHPMPPVEEVGLPQDRVSLSVRLHEAPDAREDGVQRKQAAEWGETNLTEGVPGGDAPESRGARGEASVGSFNGASDDDNLDTEAQEQVRALKQRDAEVKAHEQAHMAAGGGLVQGAASYTYEKGPDGGMYAVGGEVKIDTSPAKDPDQTITKMQQVRRAALAPAQPSSTDRSVAAQASQIEARARSDKARETAKGDEENPAEDPATASAPPLPEAHGDGDTVTRATPANPFTAPAIQAYQAGYQAERATSGPTRPFSTFA